MEMWDHADQLTVFVFLSSVACHTDDYVVSTWVLFPKWCFRGEMICVHNIFEIVNVSISNTEYSKETVNARYAYFMSEEKNLKS